MHVHGSQLGAARMLACSLLGLALGCSGLDFGFERRESVDYSLPPYDRHEPKPAEVADPPEFEPNWSCASPEDCEIASIVAGGSSGLSSTGFTCVQLRATEVICWGLQTRAEPDSRHLPTAVAALKGAALLAAGNTELCGATPDGTLKCWGQSLGGVEPVEVELPEAAPISVELAGLDVGADSVCGLDPTGAVDCFSDSPSAIREIVDPAVPDAWSIALGNQHGCAVVEGDFVRCWGENDSGQLGSGDFLRSDSAVPVEGLERIVQVAAGAAGSCALDLDGGVWCWGYIDSERWDFLESYEPGDWCESGSCKTAPEKVADLAPAQQVVLGKEHACALTTDGEVYCWGSNRAGQLGDGTFKRSATPRRVRDLTGVVQLAAGRLHVCALRASGELLCWGDNEDGQLGVGADRAPFLCISVSGTDYRCANRPMKVLGLSD